MYQILEYITQNYTFILCVLVLILLAIVGYYADKTNFGQGKNNENIEKTKKNESEPIKVEEIQNENIDTETKDIVEENIEKIENHEETALVEKTIDEKVENIETSMKPEQSVDESVSEEVIIQKQDSVIAKSENNKEFDELEFLLPKKELINDDLLNEIDGMELDLFKEKTSLDVPDLDNISLPKIKNLVEKEQDIWKF